jgi:prolyl-tRNA editing enzyme YbaK/EbsC (Cys-tRNA(Pro) deacylase)
MIPDRVRTILATHKLTALEFEPGSTPTSADAARQIGVAVGQIAKSMLLKAKTGDYYLAVCPGDKRICSKKAGNAIGSRIRMATAVETEQMTGFKPGGVCPFGVEGVEILLDRGLARYATIYPAAGNDASGVPISFEQLQAITAARVVDIMEDTAVETPTSPEQNL